MGDGGSGKCPAVAWPDVSSFCSKHSSGLAGDNERALVTNAVHSLPPRWPGNQPAAGGAVSFHIISLKNHMGLTTNPAHDASSFLFSFTPVLHMVRCAVPYNLWYLRTR